MRTRAQAAKEHTPEPDTDANGSIIADTSLDELDHMDEATINRLLDQAKTNLQKSASASASASASVSETPDLEDIKKTWQSIPKLDGSSATPTLSKKGVVTLVSSSVSGGSSSSSQNSNSGFRKIVDPIQARKQKQALRDADAGKKWFNMPKPELTPEVKRDLQLLKMRNVLDPKRHYKKDKSPLPTYFQTGTIIEGNTEYYSARLNKKDRKKSIADEILADSASRSYFKRKYADIQSSKLSGRKAYYKTIKELRKKGRL